MHKENIFMIGICGMGMAPLAIYLKQCGFQICGYDSSIKSNVKELLDKEQIVLTTDKYLPPGTQLVVYSNAVKKDNPFLLEAREKRLPVLKRGEMLAETATRKKLIAIVGSHGKTTTAGMSIVSLLKNNFSFDYILGGLFSQNEFTPALSTNSEWLVAEIDESDGTIDLFAPEITLIVNLDWDHSDQYETIEDLHETFESLFSRTKGKIIYPSHSTSIKKLIRSPMIAELISFGGKGDYVCEISNTTPEKLHLRLNGRFPQMSSEINAVGNFNGENASAALTLTNIICEPFIENSLDAFPGIKRRQTRIYNSRELIIYEDYAHHPTEINELIKFVQSTFNDRKLVGVFQPHRHSRTKQFKEEFADKLSTLDELLLLPAYSAGEPNIEGGNSEDILRCTSKLRSAHLINSYSELGNQLRKIVKEPSIIIFIGAGDIDLWANYFINILKDNPISFDNYSNNFFVNNLYNGISKSTKILTDIKLSDKTTLRIGGNAKYYSEPASQNDLCSIIKKCNNNRVPYYILGRGSNLIIPDDGFDGMVISLNHKYWSELKLINESHIVARAGLRLKQLCSFASNNYLKGFEFLEGIPGTVGGALRMNAGAMGSSIYDIVDSILILNSKNELETIPREMLNINYRECDNLINTTAISAKFFAHSDVNNDTIKKTLADYSQKRKLTQPRESSVGCIFKNPIGESAGQIIDQLGLKGHRIGNAEVSEIHGNFIVNRGGATSNEIISLIKDIRLEVYNRRSIYLEPEAKIMGINWEDIL